MALLAKRAAFRERSRGPEGCIYVARGRWKSQVDASRTMDDAESKDHFSASLAVGDPEDLALGGRSRHPLDMSRA